MGMPLGVVLPMMERPSDGVAARWPEIAAMAHRAEQLGADTVWLADEILWRVPEWSGPVGWWDCLAMAGAVAARTSSVKVGTWVMSAVQHQPGMVVRAAEALDEISGGRFVLGLGAGHAGGATAFGFHTDKTVSRYLEALEIIVPLLRGQDAVTFEGQIHRATDALVRPRGAPSRPGAAHAGRPRSADDDRSGQARRHLERISDVEQLPGGLPGRDRRTGPDL